MIDSKRISRRKFVLGGLALGVLASAPARPQSTPRQILISNVHVFDGVNEARIEKANVLIEGQFIAAVSREPISAPNALPIDG